MAHPHADLAGRVAIITGGGRGIGKGIAETFATAGARVVIADRKDDAATETEREIRRHGQQALAVTCDVRDGRQVRHMIDAAVREFGGIDVLVNNAGGIYLGRDVPPQQPFIETTEDVWDASHDLNLKTVFRCSAEAAKVMVRQRRGAIVNVASSEALRCAPGFAVYSAYKAAIVNFTRTLALELAEHGIRVNCIAPDAIPTEALTRGFPELARDDAYRHHIPLGRAGTPSEAADVALFLASDLSSFVTGVTLPVEGGMLAAGGWLRHPERGWTTDPAAFERA